MSETPSNVLGHLHVLLNKSLAPRILQILRDSRREQGQGLRFTDILGMFGDHDKGGGVSATLSALEAAKLVAKQVYGTRAGYSITADGVKAITEYERLADDPGFSQYPEIVRELVGRHAYSFLLPPQREFVTKYFPLQRNLIVAASPSAGKTLVAEFCIMDALRQQKRVLYITPYKALNRQKFDLFNRIFGEYKVVKSDGDTFVPERELLEGTLIVATYERALAGVLQNESWLNEISLVVADEISLLKDTERGSNLDLLLSLLKDKSMILTLSSHLGNIETVRSWLNADSFEVSPDEVPQEFVVAERRWKVSIADTLGSQKAEYTGLSWMGAVLRHSEMKGNDTMMVLVGNRPEAEKLAHSIAKLLPKKSNSPELRIKDSAEEETPVLKRLNSCLEHRVAFHHAGLPAEVRGTVESMLDGRSINVVVSTPTLSHGVDFPLDHVAVDLDSFLFRNGVGKIEYIQYRGRAARVGKSRGGKIYVHSRAPDGEARIRKFLSKPIEDVYPSHLDLGYIEWLTLLACATGEATEDSVAERCYSIAHNLLAVRNPKYRIGDTELNQLVTESLKALQSMGFVSRIRGKISLTKMGLTASKIDWTPPDTRRVLDTLEQAKNASAGDTAQNLLLNAVCYVGLMKNFDATRISEIVMTYLMSLAPSKKPPPKDCVKGLAITSVMRQWMDEVKIKDIISESTFRGLVQDEDIRKLNGYAGIEMRKVEIVARELGYEDLAHAAEVLSVRLKKGVKEDLVNPNPAISLFRLDDIGRIRARTLHGSGFKSLLDIYSTIFNDGEDAFVRESHLPSQIARDALQRLRTLAQSDADLQALCKKL